MQMLEICDKLDGNYNVTTAALIRRDGYEFSRANNPQLLYDAPRFMTSGGEAMFPIGMMQDGRAIARGDPLSCRSLLPFYKDSRYPDDFWRREGGFGFTPVFAGVGQMRVVNTVNGVHVIEGGHAEGLGNFIKTPPDLQTMLDTNGVSYSLRFNDSQPTKTFIYSRVRFIAGLAVVSLRSCIRTRLAFSWRPSRATTPTFTQQ